MTPDLDDLVTTITRLKDRVDELETRLHERERQPVPEGTLSRRALFGLAGAGIAGAAVGVSAAPAAADTGQPLVLGVDNTADETTTVTTPESVISIGGLIGLEATGGFAGVVGRDGREGSVGGHGVQGISDKRGGFGVYGDATGGFGIGVFGRSESFIGVGGESDSGFGGAFSSTSGPQIHLDAPFDPPRQGPPPDSNWRGSLATDSNGDLFLCTEAGAPGVWTRLNDRGPHFLPTPQRAYDSRPGRTPTNGGAVQRRLARREVREIDLTIATDVPDDSTGVVVNVTVTDTELAGYVSLAPADASLPTPPPFSTVNWSASGQTVANTTTVGTAAGRIQIYADRLTHVILDVIAFYA